MRRTSEIAVSNKGDGLSEEILAKASLFADDIGATAPPELIVNPPRSTGPG
jgi:hypothetical protein